MSTMDRMIYQVPETRERILTEAYRLLREQGFHVVKMTDIADAAGVSRTSLYRYYQDKFDISVALIERLLEEYWIGEDALRAVIDTAPTGHAKLEAYLRTFFDSPEGEALERFLAQFDAYWSTYTAPDDFLDRIAEVMPRAAFTILDEVVETGIADGSIRPDLPPGTVQVAVLNAIRGLAHRLVLRGDMLLERQTITNDEAMEAMITVALDGLRPQQ